MTPPKVLNSGLDAQWHSQGSTGGYFEYITLSLIFVTYMNDVNSRWTKNSRRHLFRKKDNIFVIHFSYFCLETQKTQKTHDCEWKWQVLYTSLHSGTGKRLYWTGQNVLEVTKIRDYLKIYLISVMLLLALRKRLFNKLNFGDVWCRIRIIRTKLFHFTCAYIYIAKHLLKGLLWMFYCSWAPSLSPHVCLEPYLH